MNGIMNISGVECYEKDGTAYLKLEAVARGLGFTQEGQNYEKKNKENNRSVNADISVS